MYKWLTGKAYRFISSWTHPRWGHGSLQSWCAGLRHKVLCGPKSSSVAPDLHTVCYPDHWPDHWLYFLSFTSFCLFKNQSENLYWCGFCMMVITCSTSSSLSSPVLARSLSAFLITTWACLCPTPLIAAMAKVTFHYPLILVLGTHKICWNFSGITRGMMVAPAVAYRPPVEEENTNVLSALCLPDTVIAILIYILIKICTTILWNRDYDPHLYRQRKGTRRQSNMLKIHSKGHDKLMYDFKLGVLSAIPMKERKCFF